MASTSVEVYPDCVVYDGDFGILYKAKYGQLLCAAKLDHDQSNEIRQKLFKLKHPNIVNYLGTFRDPISWRLALLIELVDENLRTFLQWSSPPSYQSQLSICRGVALALSYLHSNNIIHGNLSSYSVFVCHETREDIRAKVGVYKDYNHIHEESAAYMPHEVLDIPHHFSNKVDCFSFGVLTIEILTGNSPLHGVDFRPYSTMALLQTKRRKRCIDLIDPNHPLLPIALDCLHDEDTKRPPANEVCERLATLKREEFESREEPQLFCANAKKHLENSGAINRFLAHLVFVGLPGSGKTTLILRLLSLTEIEKMLRLRDLASTGVMDGIISVNVAEDKASLYTASIDKNYEWHEVQFGLSCLRQMGIQCFVPNEASQRNDLPKTPSMKAVKVSANAPETQNVEARELLKKEAQFSEAQLNQSTLEASAVQQLPARDVMETARTILVEEGFDAVRPYLDNKTTLYLSDTGGQIEFQELLPLLVALHAIFVFLFPLNVDLDAPVTVSYRKKVGDKLEHTNVYTSSLTIRESFLQTLASIDSKDDSVNPSVAKHKPYVFVVGTHKDCLIDELGEAKASEKIAEIDSKFKLLVEEHKYDDMVVYADKTNNEVLFAVDNTCDNDVFPKIRRSIFDLLHMGDEFRIEFPLSYLLASLHLQSKSEPFIKRSEFTQEVLQFGIEEEDIDHLLQFLHTRIGQIRYFPLEEIKEVIVKEPQALYNLVTCLLTKSFISRSVTMKENTEVQKGIYSFESFCDEEFFSQSDFLTPKHIILLLKELRVVAPFFDHHAEVEKYFIPCVLEHLVEPPDDSSCKMSPVQPLAIMFDCGHCPKGLFGVLLHYLVTYQNNKLNWSLDINKIFRNRVSFEVGPYEDEVTLKFYSTYLEVSCCFAIIEGRSQTFTLKKFCNLIRCTLESGIEDATKSLHYSAKKTKHTLGLVCSDCNKGHKVTEIDSQYMIPCPQRSFHEPNYWFGAPPNVAFPNLATHNVISLKENSDDTLEFLVTSDPALNSRSKICLSKCEGSPCKTRVYIDGSKIIFKGVRSSDAGIYTVTASNVVGEGQASFQLTIKPPPKLSLEMDYLEAEAGSSPTLTFTVTSDPPLPEATENTLSKSDGTKATRRFKVENNCITFRRVRVEDSGEYIIRCHSEEGEVGEATLELEVTPTQQPATQPIPSTAKTTGMRVSSHDVYFLASNLCQPASYKWSAIGLALGFLDGELKALSCSYPRATAQVLLTELLCQWVKWPTADHPDDPTMERLRDALQDRLVGLPAVANRIYSLRHSLPSHKQ